MGQVSPEARSQGQIRDNLCCHSKSHMFDSILMKLGLNGYLENIWTKLESRSQDLDKRGQKVKF